MPRRGSVGVVRRRSMRRILAAAAAELISCLLSSSFRTCGADGNSCLQKADNFVSKSRPSPISMGRAWRNHFNSDWAADLPKPRNVWTRSCNARCAATTCRDTSSAAYGSLLSSGTLRATQAHRCAWSNKTPEAGKRRGYCSEDLGTFSNRRRQGKCDGFLTFLWSFAEGDENHSICTVEWFREALGKV